MNTSTKFKQAFVRCLTILLCWTNTAHAFWPFQANTETPTIPPIRYFKWDIAPKDSRIQQDFIIQEYRVYSFDIGFGSPKGWDNKDDQSWRKDQRVWDFLRSSGEGDRKGTLIPVHIQISKINDDGSSALIKSKTVDTQSIYRGGYIVVRRITSEKLKPGKYHIIVTTTQATELPGGIGTYLHIGFYPKAREFNDNE